MRTKSLISRTAALLVASMLLFVSTASADDIRVMTSGAFTAAYLELRPQLERSLKVKIVTTATSMGVGSDSIPSRVERGEAVDVVIVADDALNQLIKDGRVLANSRVELARSSIGIAVRAGAPKPDISSLDALTRTLLQANSIAYSASVSGLYVSTELFQHLGAWHPLCRTAAARGSESHCILGRGCGRFQECGCGARLSDFWRHRKQPAPLQRVGWSP